MTTSFGLLESRDTPFVLFLRPAVGTEEFCAATGGSASNPTSSNIAKI
jgi:hypothetical protein